MRCPRCEVATLDERDRGPIHVDICPSCRGVWLDRGELEKIIHMERQQDFGEEGHPGRTPAPQGRRYSRPDSDDDYSDQRPGKRRGLFASFGDIFD